MATENTYLDVLLQRFEELADNVAYRFLQTGDVDGPVDVLTYRELGLRTRAIAGWLQEHGLEGERALLVYPPGLDFIEGFLGCVSAGVVAVPVPLPHATDFDRAMRRLAQVIEDADVSVVLTTNAVEDILQSAGGALGDIELRARTVATDTIPNSYSSQHRIPQLSAESIAFLQYTSGSTSAPKGVVVTHGNLLHNQSAISLAMGHTANGSDTVAVSWLPMYHDMGLIGPVLGTLYSGGTAILFSPLHFIQRPERWVKAISHFKATNSGGPNFAYEITARRVTQDVVESLDLSHWRLAFCGAEPVRASTVRRFADTFAPARFHRTAFQPVYGLAEATLIVCAVPLGQEPTLLALAPPDGGGAGKEVVGVGVPVSGTTVVIVDPETSRECPVGAEGEIWVASGSVSPGYLNGVAANQDVFQATLADGRSGYLRTGDLGFAADGQLFVTGRLKDVLIVDGRNLHPQDLELTAESAHDNVRPGGVAAFAVDDDETEGIVVLAEVRAEDDETLESTAAAVRRKISAEHGVRLRAVVLISARSIFKTSSGKIQRQACRGAYLDGALPNVVAVDGNPVPTAKSVDVDRQVQEQTIVAAPGADASDMQSLLQRVVAEACGIAAEDVMADRPLVELGLGSRQLVELIGVVSDQLGRPLDPSLIFEHPTVRSLADALEGESREAVAPTTGPTDDQPIAVLSMACRFPGGANTPEKLWQILHDGRDVISDVPADRWDVDGMSDAGFQGGFLPDVKSFDASFFGISPREAEAMDPHQRLLMQLSWEAMERAGIVPKHLEGTKTGVFIGMYGGQYLAGIDLRQLDGYVATGTATSVASGRISYTFGLRGPAITVDTACSSALVSLHLAAQSLRRGECDAALVGSATLLLTPSAHVEFSQLGVLSPTGRCAPFAADADGAVWSEGGGMVILKRLDDAVRDGDPVLAVIRGSAVNQDGRSQGLSAPNGLAQDEVISAALHDAGLAAQDVDYIEAHGTATAVGDRIEARSLARVFSDASRGNPLRIGAIKSNIGHTQASAGIAGLIKTILALQHNVLPISLYAGEPSADWNQTGLELVATAEPWDRRPDRVRTAGVSSFGISGTNAHVVLQEPPAAAIPMAMTNQRVSQHLPFLLSARSQHSLRSMSAKLRDFVAADPDLALADIATTLAVYRTHFEDRAVIVAQDRDELLAGLDSLASSTAADHVSIASEVKTHTGKVAFVFPGQGSQWLGMARDIYQMSETFRREFDRCDLAFYEHLGWSVTNRLIRMDDADDLARDEVVQPLLFSVMVSLAAVWQRQGIHPDAVVGHSQGEIAAAYISGVLQLSDAAGIVARRSSVLSLTPSNGRMLLIAAPIEDVVTAVNNLDNDDVSIAAVNSARAVVLSGAAEALETLAAQFEHGGAFTRLLPVRYASHSHYMDPIEDVLNHDLAHIQPQDVDSTITWYSTVTGDPIRGTTATAGYWFRNIRETVQFGITVERMIADGYRYFLEISPHPLLTTDLESIGDGATITPSVFHSLRRDVDGPRCMVASLAGMHLAGIPVDWNHALPAAKRIDLPTYAFEGKRFWLEARGGSSSVRGHGLGAADHPLVSVVIPEPVDDGVVLSGRVSLSEHSWLADHAVAGVVLMPGAAFVELVVRAGAEVGCRSVGELVLQAPMPIPEQGALQVQVIVKGRDGDGRREVVIYSRRESSDEQWQLHARAQLDPDSDVRLAGAFTSWPPAEAVVVDVDDFYRELSGRGYEYGPAFRRLHRLWKQGETVFSEITLSGEVGRESGRYLLHPVLLDAVVQTIGLTGFEVAAGEVPLPFAWEGVSTEPTDATTWRASVTWVGGNEFTVRIADEFGHEFAAITALRLHAASLDQLALSTSTAAPALYSLDWEPVTDQRAPETGEDPAWTEIDSTADSKAAVGSETHPVLILRETSPESGDWPTHVRAETIRVTEAVQQWLTHESSKRLVVVTCRATAVGPRDDVVDLAHAPVWGLLRSAQNENPNRLVLIDIDDWTQVGDAVSAATRSAAPQIALRRGQILAPRLIAGGPTPITGSDRVLESSWRLQIGDRQTLDGENFLAVAAEAEASLAPGEVRIAVRATGVNFRDVVTTLGMVSDQGALIGSEGAGVVIGVADDVRSFVVGDHVMGVIPAVGSVAVTDHRLLVPVPDGWSFAEAAGVPVAFLTAYYALVHLADLQQGQKLLVHAAAGGVGMAAVQIAQHLGAEVFATASAGKWSAVRVLGLTDERIADSRSLEFESKFSSQSDERAMDVVLGSLAGEQVDASLRLVTPGGAYIEMGKTDIRDPRQAPDGVSYAAFTLGAVEPALIQRMLAAIMAAFAAGSFRLIPTTATDVRLTPTVFRDMSQAKHIGKNVLTIPSPLNKEGTVLIVGGTGQIGRQVARHFATRHGVRHILLLSRTGAEAGDTDPIVTELAELGTAVDIRRCDAADKQQLAEVISTIPDHRPLTAVVHSAGALDDSVFAALQPQHFDRVFESKVDVAWNLHELTKDIDLSIFVMFSSIAGQFGSPGQANYAAANSFVDSLIQHRNNRGLPGTSIVWGLWAPGTGMTGHLTESDRARLRRAGVLPISADEGMRLFDEAISTAQPAPIAARIDMSPASAAGQPSSSSKHGSARNTGVSSNADLTEKLATLDAAGQRAFILSIVKAQVAATLGHSTVADVRVANTFRDLGFDSLSAVDFRNRLQNTTGIKLPATVVFDYPTPGDLAGYINEELTRKPAQPAPAANSKPASEGVASDPVVIVGMGCRFPGGVSSPAGLWDVVVGERDVISGFPVDRGWDVEGVFDPVPGTPGRSYVREGGFLDGAAEFDAGFFGISPREALAMDPQQRLLLEVSWEAVESAGIDPRRLKGSNTGVYTGVLGTSNYSVDSAASTPGLDGYRLTGNTSSVASGRVSYVLGLEGPAVSVDTACSSSLVALHLAVQGLRLGECDMALVSGVTVMPTPSAFVEFSQLRGLAADGRCKAFAEGADGFVPSEGVGVLVVERLSDAVRLGHRVLAVVRGSAVNQDGASNGLSAPNGPAQQRVIRAALANARVSPADLDAVEAHGTGTQLGDPIEAQALMATYGARAEGAQPLWLGSIKSNIGHTSAAAGVAGVIKMVMALRHEMLPATLHVDRPSAQIDWSSGQVELLTSSRAWPRDPNHVRRAGVSSFGISGTNAHVIVEEAPTMKPVEVNPVPMWPATIPWTLSGRTGDALEQQASRLWARVDGDTDVDILDVGLSLTNRTLFGYRAVVLGADRAELLSGLRALADGSAPSIDGAVLHGRAGVEGKTVFVFPGQGSQWAQMGVELFDTSTVFAVHLIECERVLTEFVDWRLTDVLRGVPGAPTLERVDVVQPALFAVMVSLARLWQSMGVHPDAVIGHSQGEVAAAHIAGALTLRDAAHLIAYRSKAIRRIAGEGTMATVAVPTADILQKTRDWTDRIEIAATNSPVSTVVSGSVAAVTRLVEEYEEAGVRARRIPVDFASHSRSVEDLRNELIALTEIRGVGSNIDFYSSTVGGLIDTDALDEQYWYQNLRETVQFDRAVDAAYADGARFFIEISPHPVLTVSLEEIFDARADPEPNFIGQTLRREEGGMQRFLASAASLFCAGGQTDWRSVFAGTNAEPIDLPTYAFEGKRFWLEARGGSSSVRGHGLGAADHPLVSVVIPEPVDDGVVLSGRVSLSEHSWLADHAVAGVVLMPGAAFVELVVRAGAEVGCRSVGELVLQAPMPIPEQGALQVQVIVKGRDGDGRREVVIYSRRESSDEQWQLHARAQLDPDSDVRLAGAFTSWPPAEAVVVDVDDFYRELSGRGYEYGPAFRRLHRLWKQGETVFSEITLSGEVGRESGRYLLHPVLLDAVVQTIGLTGFEVAAGEVPLPFAWEGVSTEPTDATTWRASVTWVGGNEFTVRIADEFGHEFAAITALRLHTTSIDQIAAIADTTNQLLYAIDWEPIDRPAGPADTQPSVVSIDQSTGYSPYPFEIEPAGETILDVVVGEESPNAELVHTLTSSILTTIQNWLAIPRFDQYRLTVRTRRAVLVSDADRELDPASAAVWGLIRSAQNENPGRFALVDTDESTAADQVTSSEPLLAIRSGQLHLPRLQQVEVVRTGQSWNGDRKTVLIVGGTGGLGELVARHLVANHGATDLILVSRSGVRAVGAEQLHTELQAQGARVRIVACDASKIEDLTRVFDAIPADAPLRAVISAAGQVSDGTVETLGHEQLHTVLRSKVDVAWNLHELTRHLDLEAFILFSSAAGSLGSPGQANYAAANAFLDAFAQYRQTLGLPGQSVAWGIWARETGGMSGRLSGHDVSRIRRSGLSQMPQDVGLELFDRVTGSAHPYLIAAAFDADSIARSSDTPGLFQRLVRKDRRAASAERATRSNLLERLKELDLDGQWEAVLTEIQLQAAEILGYEDRLAVAGDMAFKDIGFDSLTAVEFRNRLQGIMDLRLPVSTVFDHPSPEQLAKHLVNVLRERFPEKYGRSEDLAPSVTDSSVNPGVPTTNTPVDEIADMDIDALIELAERG